MFFLFGLLWKNNLIIVHLGPLRSVFLDAKSCNYLIKANRICNPLLLKARLLPFPAVFSTSTIPRTAIPSFLFDHIGQKSKGSRTPSFRKAFKHFHRESSQANPLLFAAARYNLKKITSLSKCSWDYMFKALSNGTGLYFFG